LRFFRFYLIDFKTVNLYALALTLDGKAKKPRDEVSTVHICDECGAAYSKVQHPDEYPECGTITPVEHKEVGG
jgi:rubrerythrin